MACNVSPPGEFNGLNGCVKYNERNGKMRYLDASGHIEFKNTANENVG